MRPHAFSIRTGSHGVHVQMSGSSFSLGPIHLAFLASPLYPSPFFQLLIHLPLAPQQPTVVSHCLQADLGRETPTPQVSHSDEEEHSPGKSSSWRTPAPAHQSSSSVGSGQLRCKAFPAAHTRATVPPVTGQLVHKYLPVPGEQVELSILSTTGEQQRGSLKQQGDTAAPERREPGGISQSH